MKSKRVLKSRNPYHIINSCFAGIILLVFLYSGIFPAQNNNYPIKSACEVLKGEPCSSTGLSRAFSEIVRFNFNSALEYNKHSIKVFLFFAIQFFLRILVSVLVFRFSKHINTIILLDSIISTGLYIYCFWNIIT